MNIKEIVLYTTAKCNLNCRYCFISKNQSLLEIDKDLENSFKDIEYYKNMFKEVDPEYIYNAEQIGLWGGEPTLGFERVAPLMLNLIDECYNLNKIFFSTNLVSQNVIDNIHYLMNQLKTIPHKYIKITMQISIDGPRDITDSQRGIGTTDKIITNLKYLIDNNFFLPSNVDLHVIFKGTIDKDTLPKFLDRNYIINYYKFFEDEIADLFKPTDLNVSHGLLIPNMAVPGNYTKEDGLIFAKICKMLYDISIENQKHKLFKYYKDLRWFRKRWVDSKFEINKLCNYEFCGGLCGACHSMIGVLPNGLYAGCHRSFTNYCESYCNNYSNGIREDTSVVQPSDVINDPFLFRDKHHLDVMIDCLDTFYKSNNTVLVINLANQIQYLAQQGFINGIYSDKDKALKIAKEYILTASICMSANYVSTGDIFSYSFSFIQLFLNGAIDYIIKELKYEH